MVSRQVQFFNKINRLKTLQGVQPLVNKHETRIIKEEWKVPHRKSWADLPYEKDNLVHVYRLPNLIFPNSGSKYYWHYLTTTVLLVSFILVKSSTFMLKNNEKIRIKEGKDRINKETQNYHVGFRFFFGLVGLGMILFGFTRPARTVRNIFVDKVSKNVILQCDRFFGTCPTYFILNGKEVARCEAYLSMARVSGDRIDQNFYKKHKNTELKTTISDGNIKLPFIMHVLGEAPFPDKNFDVKPDGLILINKSKLEQVRTPLLAEMLEMIYNTKKSRSVDLRPEEYSKAKVVFFNNLAIPCLFLYLWYFMITSNADLFYMDQDQFFQKMKDEDSSKILGFKRISQMFNPEKEKLEIENLEKIELDKEK